MLAPRALDLRGMPHDERHAEIEVIGKRLMAAVGAVVPVVPVPLVATALLQAAGQRLTRFELKGRVFALVSALEQAGAYVHIPRKDREYAIDLGLRALLERRLLDVTDDTYAAAPDATELLRYYANSIAHLLPTEMAAARVAAQ